MFTGIVEELGVVRRAGRNLLVETRTVAQDATIGASVAVNGVCLTVVEIEPAADGAAAALGFDVSDETLSRTAIGRLGRGDPVNLERPLTLLARLGGHLVQGHVDGVGSIAGIHEGTTDRRVSIRIPDGLERYLVEKGSVTVDGVSLTVAGLNGATFDVAVVPHTMAVTTFGTRQVGDEVNIEVDMMAKYVERLLPGAVRDEGATP
ncbi:MAG TPA: riboflavin synthase [Actinomycetota bacterium]|nr:riboflavin synthase [Actinomycetota bacterium]